MELMNGNNFHMHGPSNLNGFTCIEVALYVELEIDSHEFLGCWNLFIDYFSKS